MARRLFGGDGVREKVPGYHGGGRFVRLKPDIPDMKSLNIDLPFEEALKISLALQSCLQALNRYNRGTAQGRAMGVLLSIKTDNSSVSVIEAKLTPKTGDT